MSIKMKKRIFMLISMFLFLEVGALFAQGQFRILIFSKTETFRHETILEGVEAIRKLATKHDFSVTWTENSRIFASRRLNNYAAVVFLNSTGDVFNEDQQKGFEQYIKNGGGIVGVHGATATETDWPWFGKLLGGYFTSHPATQTAIMNVANANFPGMYNLPKKWLWTDEWYEFEKQTPEELNILLTVDESTYDLKLNRDEEKSAGMGALHPIAWYHEYDGGRAFYTGLGHIGTAYQDPLFLEHLYGGIYWTATGKGIVK
jgi:type 1 glutamine amidotransferase